MTNGKRGYDNKREENSLPWSDNDLEQIIVDGDVKKLNDFCFKLGEYYAKSNLSTSQIRNVFNEIQNMHAFNEAKLQLLRPKLAYIAGKHTRTKVIKEHFQPLVDKAIQKVNKDNFVNFKNFMEAIVAYHRYHGGKE